MKGILLTIMGWFNKKADQATDLRYAGREHIRRVNNSIEEVRAQYNEVAGHGILLENEIKEHEKKVAEYEDAVRHHNSTGDAEKRDKAYRLYTAEQGRLTEKRHALEETITLADDLKEQIRTLEQDTEEAKGTLRKAATQQVVGRATSKVEGIHKDLRSGPLAGAIEESRNIGATAEAARRARKENSDSDVLGYRKGGDVKSLDDLLGSPKAAE